MKILFIHNSYSEKTPSGEEHASNELAKLLESHGHEVFWYKANSDTVKGCWWGSFKAFFTGITNPRAAKEIEKILDDFQPDMIQVQNIYPLISSSIFKPLKKHNIPVVMRCPNYRLFCPTGLCLDRHGKVCERCWSGLYELNCIFGNCMHNPAKSIGYAIRNAFNRISRRILSGVDIFIVQSDFQKNKFIENGIPEEKLRVLSGISPIRNNKGNDTLGDWVSFIGRISPEKGIYEFIEAAKLNPDIQFRVAGSSDSLDVSTIDIPTNLKFVGFLKGDKLDEFYLSSRIVVVPSKWYEGFPNVILRAFIYGVPVITTNIGALPSVVDSEVNGLLVEPGNIEELSSAIRLLYHDDNLCAEYGRAGQVKAESLYSSERVYDTLLRIYDAALKAE